MTNVTEIQTETLQWMLEQTEKALMKIRRTDGPEIVARAEKNVAELRANIEPELKRRNAAVPGPR